MDLATVLVCDGLEDHRQIRALPLLTEMGHEERDMRQDVSN